MPVPERMVSARYSMRFVIAKNPFRGSRFFVPNDSLSHPGILILHGSEGGSQRFMWKDAEYFAARGYAVLAFCYFDKTLALRELEKTFEALAWLKNSPFVNGRKIAVYGFSRGAEQSLLIGELSATPGITVPDAILAHAPSDVVNHAWNWDWQDPKYWLNKSARFVGSQACGADPRNGPEGKPMWKVQSAWTWKGVPLPVGERIKVENYRGPVFLSVGTADKMWPYQKTQRLEVTLHKAGRNPDVHYFAGEGHVFGVEATQARNQLMLNFLGRTLF